MNVEHLRELLGGQPSATAKDKEIGALDRHCRDFIARSPFFVLASAAADGRADASPKGGPPGFVQILDDQRLAYGELPGNKRLDSFQNVLEQPFVGLLFMIPGVEETLRVNGRMSFSTEPELLERLALREKVPPLAVVVEVEVAYLHCAKAFKRSGLWEPDAWPSRDGLAPAAQIFRDHKNDPTPLDQVEAKLAAAYRDQLW